jgi:uroporphyrinogen-III synthase
MPPLPSLRVVITRAEHQSAGLAAAFSRTGARVELLPLLAVVPPADPRPLREAAAEASSYDWIVFSSANAVEAFLPLLRGPLAAVVAAVGPATAAAVRAAGIEPGLVAERSDAEGLAAELAPHMAGRRVLLPQAADARPALLAGLRTAGGAVTAVVAYDKRLPAEAAARAAELFADQPLGWVTFTSPRIVRHFVELFGAEWEERRRELRAVSIGGVTSAELRRHGVEPAAEARRPGDEEMVAAVERAPT